MAEELLKTLYKNINRNLDDYRAVFKAQNFYKTTKTFLHKYSGGNKIYNIEGLLMISLLARSTTVIPSTYRTETGTLYTLDDTDRDYITFMRRSGFMLQAYEAVRLSALAIQRGGRYSVKLTLFNSSDERVVQRFNKRDIQRIYGQAMFSRS